MIIPSENITHAVDLCSNMRRHFAATKIKEIRKENLIATSLSEQSKKKIDAIKQSANMAPNSMTPVSSMVHGDINLADASSVPPPTAQMLKKYRAALTHEGLVISVRSMCAVFKNEYPFFLNKLTLTYKPDVGGIMVKRKLFSFKMIGGEESIILPRALADTLGKLFDISVHFAPRRQMDVELHTKLFSSQQVVVNKLCGFADSPVEGLGDLGIKRQMVGKACALLNLKAGLGKTFVAAGVIASLKLRTLYVVPNKPLRDQAVSDLTICLSCKVEPYSNKTRPADCHVLVIIINSAITKSKEFFDNFSLVIYDEAHMYCSPERAKIFRLSHTWVNLGMSATTEDRRDGFDPVVAKELSIDGIIRAEQLPGFDAGEVRFQGEVKIINYFGPVELTQRLTHDATGTMFISYMINQAASDYHRVSLAVQEILRLQRWRGPNGEKHGIFVFCDERKPLAHLYRVLQKVVKKEVYAPEIDTSGNDVLENDAAETNDATDINEFADTCEDDVYENNWPTAQNYTPEQIARIIDGDEKHFADIQTENSDTDEIIDDAKITDDWLDDILDEDSQKSPNASDDTSADRCSQDPSGKSVDTADDEENIFAGEFHGLTQKQNIRRLIDKSQILLTTYGFSGQGISINRMTAIVFYTPRRSNMKQIIPRIMRRGGDTSIKREIIDIVDAKTPLKSQLANRMEAYKFYEFDTKPHAVKYNEIAVMPEVVDSLSII